MSLSVCVQCVNTSIRWRCKRVQDRRERGEIKLGRGQNVVGEHQHCSCELFYFNLIIQELTRGAAGGETLSKDHD